MSAVTYISTSQEAQDALVYAEAQLLPALELQTVLYGMVTTIVTMACYNELRVGIRTLAKWRIVRLAVAIVLYVMFAAHWLLSVRHTKSLLFGGWVGYNSLQASDAGTAVVLYPIFDPFLLETALFGTFSTLMMYAVYTFTHKNGMSRPQLVMLAIALVMYAISLSHWSLQARLLAANYTTWEGLGPNFVDPGMSPLALISVNVILSDGIVLWRACVFWRGNLLVYATAVGFCFITVALNVANVVAEARVFVPPQVLGTVWTQPAYSDTAYGTAALALSLATNLASTAAIGWKTWIHRRKILRYLTEFSPRSIVDQVMTLLWESGCVYCVIWILYIISSTSTLLDPPAKPIAEDDASVKGVDYFNRLMAQLTGIYPTLILILVVVERNHLADDVSLGLSISSIVNTSPQARVGNIPSAPLRTDRLLHGHYLRRSFGRIIGETREHVGGEGDWESDAEKAFRGSARAVLMTVTKEPSSIRRPPAAKTSESETAPSLDPESGSTSSTASVRRLYLNAAHLLATRPNSESSHPRQASSAGDNMPELQTSHHISNSATEDSANALLEEMQPRTSRDSSTNNTVSPNRLSTAEMHTPLAPNRRAPSPLFE